MQNILTISYLRSYLSFSPYFLLEKTITKTNSLSNWQKRQEDVWYKCRKQKSEKRKTPIPRQKIKYLSNQAIMLNLADFVFCDLIDVSKDQLPDNSTVFI